MDKIVALCKNRGFIFAGSDIYGGLANTWDYGPLGARLKNNVKDTWRKRFIQERKNSYEVDADILMHPRVWEASGHVASFSDPLLDCKECKMRHRADNLIDDFDPEAHADGMTKEEMFEYIGYRDNNRRFGNFDVDWTVGISYQFLKCLNVTLSTDLKYVNGLKIDKVITDANGVEFVESAERVQFQGVLGIGIGYSF